jgi:hypothetical protein
VCFPSTGFLASHYGDPTPKPIRTRSTLGKGSLKISRIYSPMMLVCNPCNIHATQSSLMPSLITYNTSCQCRRAAISVAAWPP